MPTRKLRATAPASTTLAFVEVDPEEVPESTRGRGLLSGASLALLDGKTIWIAGKNRSSRFVRMARPRHMKVRSRVGSRGSAEGVYYWLESNGVE